MGISLGLQNKGRGLSLCLALLSLGLAGCASTGEGDKGDGGENSANASDAGGGGQADGASGEATDPLANNAANAPANNQDGDKKAKDGAENPIASDNPATSGLNDSSTPAIASSAPGSSALPDQPQVPGDSAGGVAASVPPPGNAPDASVSSTQAAVPPSGDIAAASPGETSGEPQPGNLPEKGAKLLYLVRKGDTLGTIAKKLYGNTGKWKQLASDNNLKNPNRIYAGDSLYYTLNEKSAGYAEKMEGAKRQTYTVAKGDTLSGIARKLYGSETMWRVMWLDNPQLSNPDRVRSGQILSYRDFAAVADKWKMDGPRVTVEAENELLPSSRPEAVESLRTVDINETLENLGSFGGQ